MATSAEADTLSPVLHGRHDTSAGLVRWTGLTMGERKTATIRLPKTNRPRPLCLRGKGRMLGGLVTVIDPHRDGARSGPRPCLDPPPGSTAAAGAPL